MWADKEILLEMGLQTMPDKLLKVSKAALPWALFSVGAALVVNAPRLFPGIGANPLFLSVYALCGILLVLTGICGVITLIILGAKKILKKPTNAFVVQIASGCLVYIASMGVIFILAHAIPRQLPTGSYERSFVQEVWLEEGENQFPSDGPSQRQLMLGNLVESVLEGKNREQIIELLGPPVHTELFASLGRDLVYVTGWQRDVPFPLDYEWLLIWLDEDGIFRKAEILHE